MLKTRLKFFQARMSKRILRSKSAGNLLELALDMSEEGLDVRCSDLSQEEIESLCNFRLEVNMLRAQNGQEAVLMEEAMKCLRAAQFNAAKAVEIYRNYQKFRDSLQLESLKPHREPLCSELGSKKMEVVGTCDSEGAPIILFTASRHETFKWDNKSSMQLLFYTLDQVSASEAAMEKGVIFILDLRDITSDPRYTSHILSVLKDGYPVRVKTVFLVFNGPRTSKTMTSIQRMIRYDLDKVKIVHLAELKAHFLPEQLPLSLGGSYSHHDGSPIHVKSSSEDDSGVGMLRKPIKPSTSDARRGSGSNSVSRSGSGSSVRPPNGSEGRTVNQLLEMFETGGEQSAASQPQPHPSQPHPSQASNAPSHSSGPPCKPIPPPFSTKPNLKPTSLGPVRSSPIPPPKKLVSDTSDNHLAAPVGLGQGVASCADNTRTPPAKKSKKPILPSPGGRSANSSRSSNEVSAHFKQEGKPDKLKKLDGGKGGGGGGNVVGSAVSKIKNQLGEEKVPGKQVGSSKQGKQVGPSKQAMVPSDQRKSQLITAASCEEREIPSPQKKSHNFSGLSGGGGGGGKKDRPRAGSAGKLGHNAAKMEALFGAASVGASPKKLHNESPRASPPPPPQQQHKSKALSRSTYENVIPNQFLGSASASSSVPAPSSGPPPPPTVPVPAILMRSEEDSWRDSDVYENISIGFAGTGKDLSGPLPPLPPPKDSNARKSGAQAYENVEFLTPDSKMRKKLEKSLSVEDDDDRLFGDEGPPGMKDEIIYENYGPDKGNRQMSLKDLEAHVEKLGKNGLATEYCRIRNEPISGSHKACRKSCNAAKNRYKDVICYDKTRVQLSSVSGVEGSDYIHANCVDGYKSKNHFILTQGPKDKTVPDFWRMIWEKHILVIVMVTKCVELGKRKCALYWPDVRGGCGGGGAGAAKPQKHGDYQVILTDVVQRDGYDISTLRLEYKGEQRTVIHFQFLAWPDYGIPSSGSSILHLIFAVRQAQVQARVAPAVGAANSPEPHPILVHCSAGVGRSGAFCSIDICLYEMDDRQSTNYQGVVRKMRKERAYAIQTEEQYEFGYHTILEYGRNNTKYHN